jgi:uncharacterized protein YcfL
MKKPLLFVITLGAAAMLFSGCQHQEGASAPVNTTQFDLENNSNFVLLDPGAQHSVTSPGIQQRVLEDGRLEVIANLRNRENRRIQVEVNCVFKDEQGFSTGDETPFQTVILTENAEEAVKFTSLNNKARKYTIRVRQAR